LSQKSIFSDDNNLDENELYSTEVIIDTLKRKLDKIDEKMTNLKFDKYLLEKQQNHYKHKKI